MEENRKANSRILMRSSASVRDRAVPTDVQIGFASNFGLEGALALGFGAGLGLDSVTDFDDWAACLATPLTGAERDLMLPSRFEGTACVACCLVFSPGLCAIGPWRGAQMHCRL